MGAEYGAWSEAGNITSAPYGGGVPGTCTRPTSTFLRAISLYDGVAAVELAGALLTPGDFQFQFARYARAEDAQRRAGHLLDTAAPDPRRNAMRTDARIHLANSQRRQGRLDLAEATLRDAVTGHDLSVDQLAVVDNAFGMVYKDAGRYPEAAGHYAAALATSIHPDLTASIHHNLAGLAYAQGRSADAVAGVLGAILLDLGRRPPAQPCRRGNGHMNILNRLP